MPRSDQMSTKEAREAQAALVDLGFASDMDDAAHMLVDGGDIDSSTHATILSAKERERIYGE